MDNCEKNLKNAQRKEIRARLKNMSDSERKPLSHAASLNLISLPEFISAKVVLSYCAMAYECDPAFASETAESRGIRVAYPYCVDKTTMTACIPNSKDDFIIGEYDIKVPDPERSYVVSAKDIDLVIVPGMAFDKKFRRLGHGAGYYDRFLKNTDAFKVGFLYDEQMLDFIAVDAFDIEMDCIVTPTMIIKK